MEPTETNVRRFVSRARGRLGLGARYGVAVAATALSVVLRLALDPLWGRRYYSIFFFPAILISGWAGGVGPGILTTLLCIVAAQYFWMPPGHSFGIAAAPDLWSLAVLLIVGVLISVLASRWRYGSEAIRRSEATFRLAVEAAPAAVILVDRNGKIVHVNALTESLLGYERNELIGQPLETLVPPRYRATHVGDRTRFFDHSSRRPMGAGRDLHALRKDGSEVPVEIGLAPFETQDGTMVMATVTDITERKQDEQRLRDSEARFEAEAQALARLNEASARLWRIRDLHEGLDDVLGAAIDLLGADKGNIQLLAPDGRTLLIAAHRGFDRNFLEHFREVQDDESVCGRALQRMERIIAEDVEIDPLFAEIREIARESGFRAVQSTPLLSRNGEPFGMLSTHFCAPHRPSELELKRLDLYVREAAGFIERWNAEDALRRNERAGREANRIKDEFLATLSHELRNPIAAITSAAAILQRAGWDSVQVETAGAIVDRQVTHLTRLVEDLLDISRITSGKIRFEKQLISLADAIALACESIRPALNSRRQALVQTLPPDSPGLVADENRLAQAVANLIHNASRYSPEGTSIQLSLEGEGDHAVIRIRDEGRGMSPELMERIFDPFVRGEAERNGNSSPQGLGLGLSLSRAIVEHHGGTIEASSAGPGRGSVFTIRLPALPMVARAKEAPRTYVSASRIPMRILVVDDNADSASGLAELLKMDGHQVRTSPDGETAVVAAAEFRPEIVLLDIGLPGIDGYETARRLRTIPDLARTRLIALTGFGQDEDRRKAEEAGFDSHVVKPLRTADLEQIFGARSDPSIRMRPSVL
jgi:PAS domain S-box-containing protein